MFHTEAAASSGQCSYAYYTLHRKCSRYILEREVTERRKFYWKEVCKCNKKM